MINLMMSAEVIISAICLIISIFSFVIIYNKAVKNRVDKEELKELQTYVDRQDNFLHHRVDSIEKRLDEGIATLQHDVKEILKLIK